MATNNIYASLFGESPESQQAYGQRTSAYQSWLNTRKQAAERQQTDATKLAKYNALGNIITTMAQGAGWGVAGNTGGFQPYDNRAYLDAFNRAVRANEDIRNIGTQEAEYNFKMADEAYRRQLALDDAMRSEALKAADEERRAKIQNDKQERLYQLKGDLEKQKIEGRIATAEASARARYQFRIGGRKATTGDRDKFLSDAKKAYNNTILAPYYRALQQGLEPETPMDYNTFLEDYARQMNVRLTDAGSSTNREGSNRDRTENAGLVSSTENAGLVTR